MKIMATTFILPWIFLFSLSSSGFSSAKITPGFPSSIVRPEQLSVSSQTELYEAKYFTQILDHFNYQPQSYQTFQQRFLINDKYWGGAEKLAPIFVYTGNEGDIEWFAQNTGFMFDTAPHFQALLAFIEHRFYGKSIPFGGDKKVAYSNASTLGYLSSTQALADYATLIIDLKKNLSATNSPVVVFGGSYGGMLAAWFRLKYPHVTIGALASSAPILNFENITSPYSFSNIITQDFRSESENCYKVIKGSWEQIEETALQNGGLEVLRKSFRICKNYISGGAIEGWLSTAYVYTAMTDYPTPSNFLSPMPAYPVKQMCKAIDDPALGNDTFAKLYSAANIYYNYTGTAACFDLADDSDPHGLGEWTWQTPASYVFGMANGQWPIGIEHKAFWSLRNQICNFHPCEGLDGQPLNWGIVLGKWQLQACDIVKEKKLFYSLCPNDRLACTEMILPTGGNNEESIFPVSTWNYSNRAAFCKYAFDIEPRPNWITTEFGGHDIKRVLKRFGSNIIFFNGLRDPWSGGGVLESISKSIVAIVAKDGAHHVDLRFATSEDPEWLQDVRKREVKIITKWLSEYYHDLAHAFP